MKIKVDENNDFNEIEIIIKCKTQNEQVNKIIQVLNTNFYNIIGKKDNDNYVISLEEIFYFEAVDNHVFAYCEKDIYEVSYKIQELNELLQQTSFIQTSRTVILNIKKIMKVTTLVNGRILAVLNNHEKMIITRVYANHFKAKLKE